MTMRSQDRNRSAGSNGEDHRAWRSTAAVDLLARQTWPVDPRATTDVRADGDLSEVYAGPHPRAITGVDDRSGDLLRALVRAGDAATVPACLHAVLEACITYHAACAAMAWVIQPDGAGIAARKATAGGSAEDECLAERFRAMTLDEATPMLVAHVAPREVKLLPLTHQGVEVGRLWLVFARAGGADGSVASWLAPAVVLALRTVQAGCNARREHARRTIAGHLLSEAEDRTRAVLASIPDATVIAEEKSQTIVHANPAACQRFGAEVLVGRTLADAGFHDAVGDGLQPEASVQRVPTAVHGRPAWVLRVEDIRPVQRMCALAIGMHRDATVGRLAADVLREALAAEASVATALASMQYELLTAQMATHGALDACGALVDDARDAGARLRRALAGVVVLGHDNNDPPRRLDVVDVVDTVLTSLEPQLAQRATVVRALCAVPGVTASPGALALVVLHVLMNAAHAVDHGGECSRTICVATHADADTVTLTVSDDGCGVPAERQHAVFEPFASSWPGEGVEGAGLGLAVSQEILARWGGRIALESAPERGTVVRIVLLRD